MNDNLFYGFPSNRLDSFRPRLLPLIQLISELNISLIQAAKETTSPRYLTRPLPRLDTFLESKNGRGTIRGHD